MILALLLASCGVYRIDAKTLHGPTSIDLAPLYSSVHELRLLPRPVHPKARAGVELRVFRVRGVVTALKHEADGDLHLVIADPQTKETMIAEFPEARCAAGSAYASAMDAARSLAMELRLFDEVTIEGPAFFDKPHSQTGAAPNGIEIHPVLKLDR